MTGSVASSLATGRLLRSDRRKSQHAQLHEEIFHQLPDHIPVKRKRPSADDPTFEQDGGQSSKSKTPNDRKKLTPAQKSNNARVRKEARHLKKIQEKETSMAWKDGQAIHLFDLPPEILEMIFSLEQDLSVKDYMCLSGTCWYLRYPFLDDQLWRSIYKAKYPYEAIADREPITATWLTESSGQRDDGYTTFPFERRYRGTIRKSEACHFDLAIREQAQTRVLRLIGHGQEKPAIESEAIRTQALLNDYNKFSQRQLYSRGELSPSYYKNLKPTNRSQWEEVLTWFASRLPLSRTEAAIFGITGTDLPLKTRIWKYGPWQTFCLRSVNFPCYSKAEAIRYFWLSPEDLETITDMNLKLQSLPTDGVSNVVQSTKKAATQMYLKADIRALYDNRMPAIIESRKALRRTAMGLQDHINAITEKTQSCTECWSRHTKKSPRSHIWWFDFPEHTPEDTRILRRRLRKLGWT
ncbi:hypothetical protein HD553DRAFT_174939 [Filobasidium floriforme]|uniref:uncharacterized protein n=1 Tax=Filobasidium floriforme TaxID=5210 RepID=UPI001E8D1ABC|nr:uncharacterized protein HD553DRAFT_174939 [Filobasidium floriforme]KAH8088382.1 hypothetical protein HD553DRAFT_174939 [Filobasidium floriforme]